MNKLEIATIPAPTLEYLTRMIEASRWQTAKSTNYPPHLMHQYIMTHWADTAVHALKRAIAEYGFDDDFFGRPERYLVIGEHKYWNYELIVNREAKNLYQLRLELAAQRKEEKQKSADKIQPKLF